MYKVNDVDAGYRYWFYKILNICLAMFEYSGLPDTLPARELELNLLLFGYAAVFKKKGEIITNPTSIFNEQLSIYYYPNNAVYAQPKLGSGQLNFKGKDAEIIFNNSLQTNILHMPSDGGLFTFISRYARMLADIEATINIYTVNARLTGFPTASNDQTKHSLEVFYDKLEAGNRAIVSDNAIIEQFRNIDINRTNVTDGINDWLVARDKVLEMMFRDIGVKMYNPKRAQVTEDELQVNNQLLVINVNDMLKNRQQGLDRVNAKFGTNITVSINADFIPKVEVEGGSTDGTQED